MAGHRFKKTSEGRVQGASSAVLPQMSGGDDDLTLLEGKPVLRMRKVPGGSSTGLRLHPANAVQRAQDSTALQGNPVLSMGTIFAGSSQQANHQAAPEEEFINEATIPYKAILNCMMSSLGLDIHGWKVKDEGDDMLIASVDIDLPPVTRRGPKGRATLTGAIKHTRPDAIESAAEAAVRYLCDHRKVRVKDYNYTALVDARWKLMAAEFWSDAFQTKANAANKSEAEMKAKYDYMEERLNHICCDFTDVLSLKAAVVAGDAGKENQVVVTYDGPSIFPSRLDQLTLVVLAMKNGPGNDGAPAPPAAPPGQE